MPKSAISIASPSSEKRHHGPHEVVKSAYAYSGENHLEGERQMVGMHHRIFAKPTRNLAATITPATHTIAHVARSRIIRTASGWPYEYAKLAQAAQSSLEM
jgi:hypothetical protein